MSRARRLFRKTLSKYRRRDRSVDAFLGRADHVVSVPGLPFGVYVRENHHSPPYVVYNFRVPLTWNMPVKVGEDPLTPGVIQVLTVNFHSGITIPQVISVLNHYASHFLTGSDPIYLDTSQIVNSLVYIYDGMTICINSGWVRLGGKFVPVQAGYHDLTSYIPADGAIYLLIRAGVDGVISFQEGDLYPAYSDLTTDSIPEIEPGYVGLSAARLYSGQLLLSQVIESRDVVDLRFASLPFEKLDDLGEPDDNADLDSDTTRHGLLPKLSGVDTEFLDGTGHFTTPEGGGGGGGAGDLFWSISGPLSTGDDVAVPLVVSRDLSISSVLMYVVDPGSAGATTIDIELNNVSIFGTQPSVTYDDADQKDEEIPTTVALTKGDILSLNLDAVATDSAGLFVIIIVAPQFEAAHRQASFTLSGEMRVLAGRMEMPNKTGQTLVLVGVYLNIRDAPTGASLIVDVNTDGTSLFTTQANRPSIAAGDKAGFSETLDITSWYPDEIMTVDIDQVGAGVPGRDLVVTIAFQA